MGRRIGQRKLAGTFDSEFRFLIDLDSALEGWRAWAAEYWAKLNRKDVNAQSALTAFLVTYLHGQGLHTLSPEAFFAQNAGLPTPDEALRLRLFATEKIAKAKHDAVSDFLDWVLRHKLSVLDTDGHRMVPPNLANPFPRRRAKIHGKSSDLNFVHVLELDPKLEDWRSLAADWLKDQKSAVNTCRTAVDKLLIHYIHGQNLERNYGRFLLREIEKPDFAQVFVSSKRVGTQTLQVSDVEVINMVANFLDWVLVTKLGDPETGEWDRSRFHNPVRRIKKSGLATNAQSDKASLSIRYIRELRGMLAEGRNFRDWAWAQQVLGVGASSSDWFVVDPTNIDLKDPDCVARQRAATKYERDTKRYPSEVWELWSPVRAVALYIKLELPLRTFQVRMLESGEADTWRYVH